MPDKVKHPAKFSNSIIEMLDQYVVPGRYLDPFAGTGKVYRLVDHFRTWEREIVGVEIEPEWANLDPRTVVGDALALPFADQSFSGIITSPTYGNRFADHHRNRDGSVRRSYTHDLGRALHPNNSGSMQWGPEYRKFHERAWVEATRVATRWFFLNCKNHVRKKEVQPVTAWHVWTLEALGWEKVREIEVPVSGFGMGANHLARVDHESIVILQKR